MASPMEVSGASSFLLVGSVEAFTAKGVCSPGLCSKMLHTVYLHFCSLGSSSFPQQVSCWACLLFGHHMIPMVKIYSFPSPTGGSQSRAAGMGFWDGVRESADLQTISSRVLLLLSLLSFLYTSHSCTEQ
jgi:hypothetical protein